MESEIDFNEIIQRELDLLKPETRLDRNLLSDFLHPDFMEFGASGRIWDLESLLSTLPSEMDPDEIRAFDFLATRLSADAVLLTYKSERAGRISLRSSYWCKNSAGSWVMRFHQGTNTSN